MTKLYANDTATNYEMTILESQYIDNGKRMFQTKFTIVNISDQNLILVLEDNESISNSELLYKRFKANRGGGLSFMNMITDPNSYFTKYSPSLEDTFFKIIPPNKEFQIFIISENLNSHDIVRDKIRIFIPHDFGNWENCVRDWDASLPASFQPNYLILMI